MKIAVAAAMTTLPGHDVDVAPLAPRVPVVTWSKSRGGTTRSPPSTSSSLWPMIVVRWSSPTASAHSAGGVT